MTQDVRSDPGGLVPGEQLAGYQIQEQIGRGGMAVVYRALDLRLGRPVALKVLAPQLSEDQAFRQRFIRESRAAAGVDHPHIIPVFEAGEAAGVLFIAMRYVGHGDVRSLLDSRGRLGPARTAAIVSQVASALDAAHGHGLVHRDVKPANILLALASDDSDHVYLSDFGLSKHSLTPSTLTSTGQFLGTLDYVAPEQIQGHPVDGRADQYALACATVEMLTGSPPFLRDDTMALMWAQLEAEPPRLTDRRPELGPAVDQVIAAAMAKSPAGRYASCRDFAVALSAACDQSQARADQASASRPEPGPQADRAPWADPAPQAERAPWAESAPWDRPGSYRAGSAMAGSDPRQPPDDQAAANWLGPVPHGSNGFGELSGRQAAAPGAHPPLSGPGGPPAGNPPVRNSGDSHRSRNVALGVLISVAVLAILVAVGYRLAHRQHSSPPAAGISGSAQASAQDPARIVREYFAAINRHRYVLAWRLTGRPEGFSRFVAGFAGTAHDTVTILSVKGDVVSAKLVAHQNDGTAKTFEGTYTVTGGVISKTDVQGPLQ